MKDYRSWDADVGSALGVPGGNPVDGLPPARHTETIAKLARLGPAENDELMQKIMELTTFCSMKHMKTQENLVERISKSNMNEIK